MNQRVIVRYSIGFKLQVVDQLESGRFSSICEAKGKKKVVRSKK